MENRTVDSDDLRPIVKVVINALKESAEGYKSLGSISKDTGIPQNQILDVLRSDNRIKKIFSTKVNDDVYALKKNNVIGELWDEVRQLSYFKLGGGL